MHVEFLCISNSDAPFQIDLRSMRDNNNNKYTLEKSTGWKFHSLNDISIIADTLGNSEDVAGSGSSSSTEVTT